VIHSCNTRTWEAQPRVLQVQGQSGLYIKTLFPKKKEKALFKLGSQTNLEFLVDGASVVF
jgi:hypothetical protein